MGGSLSGLAALVGAGLLALKSLGILATGEQVPFAFEAAPMCLGVCVLTLPRARGPAGRRGSATSVIAGLAVAVGLAALLADIAGGDWGAGLGLAMLGVSAGALVAGWEPDDLTDRALLVAGVSPFVGLTLGGVLETYGERLLEIGLLLIAAAWAWLGILLLRGRRREAGHRAR